ncbi:MAG: hypothetical protein GY935_09000 [Gammaproteobacteria bacterium]|nr:hypothetical protein [Gammaproteobacteria bacterium]
MATSGSAKQKGTTKPKRTTSAPHTKAEKSLESIFLDYVDAVQKSYSDSQIKSSEIYEAYLHEVGDSYAELQKQVENIQREYEAAIQEASGEDDAIEQAEKIYNEAVRTYEQLVEDTQLQGEQINKKLVSLFGKQSNVLQKQSTEAITTYIGGLQELIQQLDGANVALSDLEYLSLSVGAIAYYANATGALSN